MSTTTLSTDDAAGTRPSPRRRLGLDVVGLLARLVLGVALLVAGVLKAGNPVASARAVQAYDVLPFELARWVGYGLPWIEIVVGALLVLGLFTRVAAVVGGLLMLAFVIGIGQAWARGLAIDCGCFGGGGAITDGSDPGYLKKILQDLGLFLCGAWLAVRPASLISLDRVLFGR